MGHQKIAHQNPKKSVQKKSKIFNGEKVIGNSKFLVYEGTPGIFFQICTDILLDKPSILAEETLLCTDV